MGGEKDSDKDPLVERVAVHINIQNIQNVQNIQNASEIFLSFFLKVESMIFSCSQVYSMDPNGFTGRPGTGRVSREAFATMTQVHLSFKTCICLCLGIFICHYDPGSIVFVILNMYSSLSRSLYLQI